MCGGDTGRKAWLLLIILKMVFIAMPGINAMFVFLLSVFDIDIKKTAMMLF